MVETIDGKPSKELWLRRYREHLRKVLGLSSATERSYLNIARKFLVYIEDRDPDMDLSSLKPRSIVGFVRFDAASRTGQGPNTTAVGTRSFLRFLVSTRVVDVGFNNVVPQMRCYKHAVLPSYLTDEEVNLALSSCDLTTSRGLRDHALLMLLSRLGLRLDEVVRLTIDDVDWRRGVVLIRSAKTRAERKLPLAADVAKSLLSYVRQARPAANSRHVFVQTAAPFKPLASGTLGKVIKRLLNRAGLKNCSAHMFRHAAATKMVNQGVTFKEIADLLGHQSLRATTIYAKLDWSSLGKIALPWPEAES